MRRNCSTRRGQRGCRLRGTPDSSTRTGQRRQRGAIMRRKAPPCAALARRQAPGGAGKLERHPHGEQGAERAAIQEWTARAAWMQAVAGTVEVALYHAWRVPALPARRDCDCILLARRCCCSRSPHAERLLVVRENEAAAAVRGTTAWKQATRIERYGVRPLEFAAHVARRRLGSRWVQHFRRHSRLYLNRSYSTLTAHSRGHQSLLFMT